MALLILSRPVEQSIRAEREALGIDRRDEVWDGVYVMSPEADDQHQDLVGEFDSILREIIARRKLGKVRPGVNVSDRDKNWRQNYRVPDVVVFLRGTKAKNRGKYWHGGPDFALEITSEGDQTREKLPFYAKVGTRELLLVDREPWGLELYRLNEGELRCVGKATAERPVELRCDVVPLSFRLRRVGRRVRIEVTQLDGEGQWRI
jgi:Uma2 family endonuclease